MFISVAQKINVSRNEKNYKLHNRNWKIARFKPRGCSFFYDLGLNLNNNHRWKNIWAWIDDSLADYSCKVYCLIRGFVKVVIQMDHVKDWLIGSRLMTFQVANIAVDIDWQPSKIICGLRRNSFRILTFLACDSCRRRLRTQNSSPFKSIAQNDRINH